MLKNVLLSIVRKIGVYTALKYMAEDYPVLHHCLSTLEYVTMSEHTVETYKNGVLTITYEFEKS